MSMTGHDTASTARSPEETGRRPEESGTTSAADRDQQTAEAEAEHVGLSSRAREVQRVRAVAQEAPEVRAAKVEAARRAVLRGSLVLQGQALAEKLLQESLRR